MKYIDADRVSQLLPFESLVPALAEAFTADITVPLRQTLKLPSEAAALGTSLLMPAWEAKGFYGVKIVNVFPENRSRGLPGLHSVYVLFEGATGVPLAILDGDVITSRRTAAASALGVSLLANADAARLLVVGAGRVGSLLAPAIATVRQLDSIEVWDIDPEAAQACAARWRAQGMNAHAVDDLQGAVRRANIVSCATLATAPLIEAQWLSEGSHLDLIGSFTPEMSEAQPECFANAGVWVDTLEAIQKSGDVINAMASEYLSIEGIQGDLARLCRRECGGRRSPGQRTVFKAVGSALEDLAAAKMAFESNVSIEGDR